MSGTKAGVAANDSGSEHVASLLDVPTISVYKRCDDKFIWRPDFCEGEVVVPSLSINIMRRRFWKLFIRPRLL